MVAAVYLLQRPKRGSRSRVVLYLATSTTLISYLLIFPAGSSCAKPRPRAAAVPARPERQRPDVVCAPSARAGCCWARGWRSSRARSSELTGHSYSVMDSYGVTRLRFEVFTLGTLAVVLVFGLIGYVLAADVRAKTVDIPLEAGLEPAAGD